MVAVVAYTLGRAIASFWVAPPAVEGTVASLIAIATMTASYFSRKRGAMLESRQLMLDALLVFTVASITIAVCVLGGLALFAACS